MGKRQLELAGKRFGKLLPFEKVAVESGPSQWLCRCDCGETVQVVGKTLTRTRNPKLSCGCADKRFAPKPRSEETIRSTLLKRSVVSDTGCLMWLGATYKGGYGRISIEGKNRSAHRVSYEIFNGQIPDEMHVLHRCDTPGCIEPSHLFLGTHQDNMRDMLEKGRHGGGGWNKKKE